MLTKDNQRKLIYTAMFAAVVVVLQMFVSIPIGMFTITLTLVPVMLGAILFGPISGAILGGVFGVVVAIQVITGAAGPASTLMLVQAPVTTVVLCILKGAVAGLASGLVYKAVAKREKSNLAVILSAVVCPIVNTGIFCLGLVVFYNNLLNEWAIAGDYASAFTFIILGLIGLNFVIEFAVNVLLIPVALRMIKIVKRLI
ncbi:MAG: ECF transporter S component [Clostridia bacterium]|nr:ECF transporter S component [Clostridia bacterium]